MHLEICIFFVISSGAWCSSALLLYKKNYFDFFMGFRNFTKCSFHGVMKRGVNIFIKRLLRTPGLRSRLASVTASSSLGPPGIWGLLEELLVNTILASFGFETVSMDRVIYVVVSCKLNGTGCVLVVHI